MNEARLFANLSIMTWGLAVHTLLLGFSMLALRVAKFVTKDRD